MDSNSPTTRNATKSAATGETFATFGMTTTMLESTGVGECSNRQRAFAASRAANAGDRRYRRASACRHGYGAPA
jgi:hypothetical protein